MTGLGLALVLGGAFAVFLLLCVLESKAMRRRKKAPQKARARRGSSPKGLWWGTCAQPGCVNETDPGAPEPCRSFCLEHCPDDP